MIFVSYASKSNELVKVGLFEIVTSARSLRMVCSSNIKKSKLGVKIPNNPILHWVRLFNKFVFKFNNISKTRQTLMLTTASSDTDSDSKTGVKCKN